MLTIVTGIIMLGILVFIHEFGHFCVAKLAGVKVLKFSLGFGPRLVSRTWGETEYMICAIPLGGYVQMLGEGGGEEGEEGIEQLSADEQARSFANKPVSRRMAIVAAGPIMNLLLPFLVLPVAYMVGVKLPTYLDRPPCVGFVAPSSDGAKAGFQSGDCITALNNAPVPSWTTANRELIDNAGSSLRFTVERNGHVLHLKMHPADGGVEGLQSLGLLPHQDAVVGALAPAMPAEKAGIKVGDRILAIGETSVDSWYELREIIQKTHGSPTLFAVKRGDQVLKLRIAATKDEAQGGDYLIGIAPKQQTVIKRFGLLASLRAGSDRSMELINLTLVFIQKLFSGDVPTRSIGGPITVIQVAGQAAKTDFASVLSVLAFLSIQLGILNLFPIPILDGGHLFFSLYELIFRRPLSLRTREILQQIGLVLIL
ncbi:MAG TPA: RIP metalloprotease RseP, partial [Desulfuromonadales bacterium]|nr:RIP metalloprotease RseP [Desulfuromonadales bacterium]